VTNVPVFPLDELAIVWYIMGAGSGKRIPRKEGKMEIEFAKLEEPVRRVAIELSWLGAKIIAVLPPRTLVIESVAGETKSLYVTKENFSTILTAFEIGYELGYDKACRKLQGKEAAE
jgi:hypothetical protein